MQESRSATQAERFGFGSDQSIARLLEVVSFITLAVLAARCSELSWQQNSEHYPLMRDPKATWRFEQHQERPSVQRIGW